MPDSFDYTTGTNSENVRLLQALIDDAPEYTEETNSRNANILKSIINNTEYTDAPQSEIEELLLRLKAKIGGEIEVDELNVTENGIYDAGVNKAYNPVTVAVPLGHKTITANGTYTASDDNLAGFNEVTVAVEGYAKKSISNTPTDIATFNASALPMPSLTVSIEATQSGSGDPSPTNVRPISGWNAVNVYDTGKNLFEVIATSKTESGVTWTVNSDGSITVSGTATGYTSIGVGEAIVQSSMGKVTISGISETTNIAWGSIDIRDKNNTVLYTITSGSTYTHFTVDLSQYPTAHTITMSVKRNNNGAVSGTIKPQVEFGTTITTYEPYNGQTYTTALKDGQGNPLTCYGGQLENVNGVQTLTVTHANIASYNGETINEPWISSMDVYSTGATPTTGAQVVYPLATPTEITQSTQAISTQDGTNNLWADSGKVISGEYMEAL